MTKIVFPDNFRNLQFLWCRHRVANGDSQSTRYFRHDNELKELYMKKHGVESRFQTFIGGRDSLLFILNTIL